MTVRNITDYANCADAVSPNDLPPPPTSLLARNHTEPVPSYSAAVTASSHRNTNATSLPTSPVHVPAPPMSLSSPTDSYDSGALGKVTFVCTLL